MHALCFNVSLKDDPMARFSEFQKGEHDLPARPQYALCIFQVDIALLVQQVREDAESADNVGRRVGRRQRQFAMENEPVTGGVLLAA